MANKLKIGNTVFLDKIFNGSDKDGMGKVSNAKEIIFQFNDSFRYLANEWSSASLFSQAEKLQQEIFSKIKIFLP